MQLDSFLKLEGQDGSSSDITHAKEFEILSFHHRVHRPQELTGDSDVKRPAAATHGEITVLMLLDAQTPLLLKSICTAVQYTKGIIVCRGALKEGTEIKHKDLYTVTLEKAVLTRVHYVANPVLHGFGRQNMPMPTRRSAALGPVVELEMLYFGKITWEYGTVSRFATPNA